MIIATRFSPHSTSNRRNIVLGIESQRIPFASATALNKENWSPRIAAWHAKLAGAPPNRESLEETQFLYERFIEQQLSGVFFARFENNPDKESANRRITERLRSAGITVVLLDRDICPFLNRSSFDMIGIDNFADCYLLAEHLLKLSVERIANPPPAQSSSKSKSHHESILWRLTARREQGRHIPLSWRICRVSRKQQTSIGLRWRLFRYRALVDTPNRRAEVLANSPAL